MLAPVVAALALLTGCGSSTGGQPHAVEADHTCSDTSVPLTTIDAATEGDPQLQIPQPPGWDTSDKLNSPLIRFAMINTDLTTDGFAPNAVVTFETAATGAADPAQVFDQQRGLLETQLGATDVSTETSSLCGYPAATISYTAPAMGEVPERAAKVLCVLAEVDGTTYLSTVTVSSVTPDESTYAEDSKNILAGFRVNA
jgi:hypothetical protein